MFAIQDYQEDVKNVSGLEVSGVFGSSKFSYAATKHPFPYKRNPLLFYHSSNLEI
jgi:hypothetical protein